MIGIIDYNMGNIQSVVNAFKFIGADVCVIEQISDFTKADQFVLPGVGAFGKGMEHLEALGFIDPLVQAIVIEKKPFLGICLGMQIICKESFEFGHYKGLGWIDASVKKFNRNLGVRIPHIGWNNLNVKKNSTLINLTDHNEDVYFVHSFCVDDVQAPFVAATCEYGQEFVAMIEQDNIFSTQFHPEKSQKVGLNILRKFAGIQTMV